jgi:hypothetical protein
MRKLRKNYHQSNLPFPNSLYPASWGDNPDNQGLRRGGITLSATMEHNYDLRSRGPVTLGPEVLDIGMAIGWVVRGYIVRESIPARQNSTHTRTHKRSWVWISTHTRTCWVSVIQQIPVIRPPTTILAFNIKQRFYHISKTIIIPAA